MTIRALLYPSHDLRTAGKFVSVDYCCCFNKCLPLHIKSGCLGGNILILQYNTQLNIKQRTLSGLSQPNYYKFQKQQKLPHT